VLTRPDKRGGNLVVYPPFKAKRQIVGGMRQPCGARVTPASENPSATSLFSDEVFIEIRAPRGSSARTTCSNRWRRSTRSERPMGRVRRGLGASFESSCAHETLLRYTPKSAAFCPKPVAGKGHLSPCRSRKANCSNSPSHSCCENCNCYARPAAKH
jgi:hypothetical protein